MKCSHRVLCQGGLSPWQAYWRTGRSWRDREREKWVDAKREREIWEMDWWGDQWSEGRSLWLAPSFTSVPSEQQPQVISVTRVFPAVEGFFPLHFFSSQCFVLFFSDGLTFSPASQKSIRRQAVLCFLCGCSETTTSLTSRRRSLNLLDPYANKLDLSWWCCGYQTSLTTLTSPTTPTSQRPVWLYWPVWPDLLLLVGCFSTTEPHTGKTQIPAESHRFYSTLMKRTRAANLRVSHDLI